MSAYLSFSLADKTQACTRIVRLFESQPWDWLLHTSSHDSAHARKILNLPIQWWANDGGAELNCKGRSVSSSLACIPFPCGRSRRPFQRGMPCKRIESSGNLSYNFLIKSKLNLHSRNLLNITSG